MSANLRRQRVNIKQAMVIADVSRRTIYNWIDKGKVEYIRTAGGAIRIYVDTLLRPDSAPDNAPPDVGADVPGGGANP